MYFFTYGTLQPGANVGFFEDYNLGAYMDFHGYGSAVGTLHALQNIKEKIEYPGLIESDQEEGRVKGSIFRVHGPEPLFKIMDPYEGYTEGLSEKDSEKRNFYIRKPIQVKTEEGVSLTCSAYVLNTNSTYYHETFIVDHGIVESGDWLSYIKG